MKIFTLVLVAQVGFAVSADEPKTAYFADGDHGGVYGRYPRGYTGFLVEQLAANPSWKHNREIKPGTRRGTRRRAGGVSGEQKGEARRAAARQTARSVDLTDAVS
jgi:hypothetical protein